MAFVIGALEREIRRLAPHRCTPTTRNVPEWLEREHHKRGPRHVLHGSGKIIWGLQHRCE
jgi:hypothetical protein